MFHASIVRTTATECSRAVTQQAKRSRIVQQCTRPPIRQLHNTSKAFPLRDTYQCQIRRFTQQTILRERPAGPYNRGRRNGFVAGLRALVRSNPVSVSLAFAIIITASGIWVWFNYAYWKYFHMHNYPEAVAIKLRRAIYYTTQDIQPEKAVEYYKKAILMAEQEGMDCFSDEVIGIKLAVAGLMERIGQYPKSIQALEVIMRDCLVKAKEYDGDTNRKKDRSRLLKWTTSIAVKLGELYARPEVWNRDAAEERLSWAVETMLKERRRRDTLKISDEDEGPWISNEELATTIENLAQNYESQDQHYLAAPLFLHAINLHPEKSCHTAVLMNNLAGSLCQQSPRAATAIQSATNPNAIAHKRSSVPVTREMLLTMAQTWAQTALVVAGSVQPPERNEECDVGCVVATHNLGEIAEMMKNVEEAKKRYYEAISLARAIGFDEGVQQSSERLQRLERGV